MFSKIFLINANCHQELIVLYGELKELASPSFIFPKHNNYTQPYTQNSITHSTINYQKNNNTFSFHLFPPIATLGLLINIYCMPLLRCGLCVVCVIVVLNHFFTVNFGNPKLLLWFSQPLWYCCGQRKPVKLCTTINGN